MLYVTGSGKTYTMVGTQDNPGIMVRALNHLFETMDKDENSLYKVGSFRIGILAQELVQWAIKYSLP